VQIETFNHAELIDDVQEKQARSYELKFVENIQIFELILFKEILFLY
jgi:hypothetical protein